mgnify:CR=1 FL=1
MNDKMIIDAAYKFAQKFPLGAQLLCARILEVVDENNFREASVPVALKDYVAMDYLAMAGYIKGFVSGKEVCLTNIFWRDVEDSIFVCQSDVFDMPKPATDGAACFDIQSASEAVIPPGGTAILDTGLRFRIPVGHALMVYSRSGHGFKYDVSLSNGTGVIDSDYRGELKVKLRNDGAEPFTVKHGDRIAQAMLIKLPSLNMIAGTVENDTARGSGGFGSTGN